MNRMRKCNDEVYKLAKGGTHWKTLADPKFISLTTIQVGKKIKDRKKRVFGSASYKHYTRKA
jgi:type IV secretory pathway VirB3-like protein